jgi:membrane protein implicated in regulation of membrane protease activity
MINLTLLWLIVGSALCLMEFFFPTAFTAFMMGVAALLTAALSYLIPSFTLQICFWLLGSVGLTIASRRLFTPNKSWRSLQEDDIGKTITAIAPGEAGRVLYEGNSWRAECLDEHQAIGPNEKVLITEKKGTTLIVMPYQALRGKH